MSDITIRCLIIQHHLRLFALVGVCLVELDQVLNIFLATEEDRATFMYLSGLDVKDPLGSRGGESPSLYGDVSDALTTPHPRGVHTCSVR